MTDQPEEEQPQEEQPADDIGAKLVDFLSGLLGVLGSSSQMEIASPTKLEDFNEEAAALEASLGEPSEDDTKILMIRKRIALMHTATKATLWGNLAHISYHLKQSDNKEVHDHFMNLIQETIGTLSQQLAALVDSSIEAYKDMPLEGQEIAAMLTSVDDHHPTTQAVELEIGKTMLAESRFNADFHLIDPGLAETLWSENPYTEDETDN